MRKRPFMLGVLSALCCVSLLVGGVVAYASSGTPEVDNANATIKAHGGWQMVSCGGEDTKGYRTYSAVQWTGTETQNASDATDLALTGVLSLSGITWTIQTLTRHG